MTEELKNTVTVAEMLRTTGNNTAEFMEQVAAHIEKLEEGIASLQSRVTELEDLLKSK
jgi:peptidoglycan hydrolase CwlO-like protein